MAQLIDDWVRRGLVERYEADGVGYLWFPSFAKNQVGLRKDRESSGDIPPIPDNLLRKHSGVTPDHIRKPSAKHPAEVEGEVEGEFPSGEHEPEVEGEASPPPTVKELCHKVLRELMPTSYRSKYGEQLDEWILVYGDTEVYGAVQQALTKQKFHAAAMSYILGTLTGRDADRKKAAVMPFVPPPGRVPVKALGKVYYVKECDHIAWGNAKNTDEAQLKRYAEKLERDFPECVRPGNNGN